MSSKRSEECGRSRKMNTKRTSVQTARRLQVSNPSVRSTRPDARPNSLLIHRRRHGLLRLNLFYDRRRRLPREIHPATLRVLILQERPRPALRRIHAKQPHLPPCAYHGLPRMHSVEHRYGLWTRSKPPHRHGQHQVRREPG